jgi:hypothetical protein
LISLPFFRKCFLTFYEHQSLKGQLKKEK